MKLLLAAAFAATLVSPASALAQAPAAPAYVPLPADASERTAMQLRDKALQGSGAYAFVEELTTRFGPRLAGTAAEHRAADWTAERFRAMGFQNVRVEQFPLSVWRRGVERAEILGPHAQPLTVTSLGGSPPTPAQGIEAEAVLFETWADLLEAAPGSLRGKIAVVLQETPRTQTGSGYGSTSVMRAQGPREAARRGAVAFVLRSLGTHDHRFPHTGATLQEPGIVLVGGHLDSWDLGTGAIDDGAGVAITSAALKLIADMPIKPRRTIRMVAWGAEEVSQPAPRMGLAGARFYADSRKAELANHVIVSESDFGARSVYSLALPAKADPTLVRRATRVLAPLGIHFDPTPAAGGGPDTTPLVQQGVPAFRLNQDGTDYFDTHHTADDVLERIDPKQLDQNVAAWAALLWLIADSDVQFRQPVAAPAAR